MMVEEQDQVVRRVRTRALTGVSPFVELTSKLFFRAPAPRTLAVVSAKPREGVSWFCQSFREFLIEEMATQVSLLDAAECLEPATLAASSSQQSSAKSNFSGLVPSKTFHSAILRSDILLIDCPSLATSLTALALAAHVDGILLVIEDGKRSKQEIQGAVTLLEGAHGHVLGAVLNKQRNLLPHWLRSLFA